jgi:hypothetical protein
MEIQLIKKTELTDTYWYTQVNGFIVSGTVAKTETEAKELFKKVVEMNGNAERKEVIESINLK